MRNPTVNLKASQLLLAKDREARLEEIRQLIEQELRSCALSLVKELFEEEVETLCGRRFERKQEELLHRGGSEKRGKIYVEGQRMQVTRPRVRGSEGEVPLESYQALQDFDVLSEEVKEKLIRGISTRDYSGAIRSIEGGLGLKHTPARLRSGGSVSRAFIRASQKDLDLLNTRDLSSYKFIAIFIDGIEFAKIHLVVAMGVIETGQKLILGLLEGSTENERLCLDLLHSILERGFKVEGKILAVMDGGKGLHAAVKKIWGEEALIQRCLVHKKRNILDYLPKSYQAEAKRRLNAAWGLTDYEASKEELFKVEQWLEKITPQAAASLREGMEETLTLHKLKIPEILRRTFSTTNPLESAFSLVRERSRRVKNWRKGQGQVSRWSATCLLVAEKRMKRIRGFRYLPLLQAALNNKNVETKKEVA